MSFKKKTRASKPLSQISVNRVPTHRRAGNIQLGSRIGNLRSDPVSRIPDLGSPIRDPGSQIADPRSRTRDPGSGIPGPVYHERPLDGQETFNLDPGSETVDPIRDSRRVHKPRTGGMAWTLSHPHFPCLTFYGGTSTKQGKQNKNGFWVMGGRPPIKRVPGSGNLFKGGNRHGIRDLLGGREVPPPLKGWEAGSGISGVSGIPGIPL